MLLATALLPILLQIRFSMARRWLRGTGRKREAELVEVWKLTAQRLLLLHLRRDVGVRSTPYTRTTSYTTSSLRRLILSSCAVWLADQLLLPLSGIYSSWKAQDLPSVEAAKR